MAGSRITLPDLLPGDPLDYSPINQCLAAWNTAGGGGGIAGDNIRPRSLTRDLFARGSVVTSLTAFGVFTSDVEIAITYPAVPASPDYGASAAEKPFVGPIPYTRGEDLIKVFASFEYRGETSLDPFDPLTYHVSLRYSLNGLAGPWVAIAGAEHEFSWGRDSGHRIRGSSGFVVPFDLNVDGPVSFGLFAWESTAGGVTLTLRNINLFARRYRL